MIHSGNIGEEEETSIVQVFIMVRGEHYCGSGLFEVVYIFLCERFTILKTV